MWIQEVSLWAETPSSHGLEPIRLVLGVLVGLSTTLHLHLCCAVEIIHGWQKDAIPLELLLQRATVLRSVTPWAVLRYGSLLCSLHEVGLTTTTPLQPTNEHLSRRVAIALAVSHKAPCSRSEPT